MTSGDIWLRVGCNVERSCCGVKQSGLKRRRKMVKIFKDNDLDRLEEDINNWEEEQDGKIIIHDRLQSQDSGTTDNYGLLVVISIWYNRR